MEKIYAAIQCIKQAFPEGIDHVYEDLIACLKDDFTAQNLAARLSYLCGKEPIVVQNDIQNDCTEVKPSEVMEALIQAGYQKDASY